MNVVGHSVVRLDAEAKVKGETLYATDLSAPGMLHVKCVFARRPHARIKAMDASRALTQPGVAAILTAQDVPVNRYGLTVVHQPVLCDEIVRHVGERVAAVVAETADQASQAADLVHVDYEDLPVVEDPLQGLEPHAPCLHPDYPGNLAHTVRLRRGDFDAAMAEADVIVEREYRTPRQEHAFLEPEAGLAYIDDAGRVTVHCAGQSIHDDQRQIAESLNLPLDRVRVIYGPIGGAFGGREDISVQIILALAAWKLQRPVKIVWTRDESTTGHGKRHAMILRHRWGARRDGKVLAARVEAITDAGAYMSTSADVANNFRFTAIGAYDIPNVSLEVRAVFTNNVPACAMRGFGSPQATFAAELQIEHLAEKLGIDPVTIRLRNCLRDDSALPTQSQVPGGVSLTDLIQTCAREAGVVQAGEGWRVPHLKSDRPNKRRGIGFAIAMKNSGFNFGFLEKSYARVVLRGGATVERAEVHTAAADVGQGAHSALAQIAAEVLKVPLDCVVVIASDTADAQDSGPASASRLTLFAGNAVRVAAEQALGAWQDETRPAVAECRWDAPRTTPPDPETGACVPSVSFTYGAQAVEVEVDVESGDVEVKRVVAVVDPGRAVNPQQVLGQIEGAVAMALGWSLTEDFVTDKGRILSSRFSTYLIPSLRDIPARVDCILIEKPDPVGPFGVRGVGEIGLIPFAPALVAAVHNATGLWFDRIPLNYKQVLTGLRSLSQPPLVAGLQG